MIRLATDVGGTFTDLVGYDERSGELFTAKSLTTVPDQSIGVLDAIASAETKDGLRTRDVTFFAHGGTTVINAITERKGVRTALVTTAGFRDVLEIGRGNRPDLYNLRFRSPAPFVPRSLRFEVRERLDASGKIITPLHVEDLKPIIAQCKAERIEAVAILFLHSYTNPEHEILCADILAAALPDATVCASYEVSRQWREYERSNTVVLNAYVQPIIRRYFARLEDALMRRDLTCPYYAMQSNGGIATFEQAVSSPLSLVESGPAGGVAGAARIGNALGESEVLSLDVGGTTAKCSLIHGGRPTLNVEYKLEHTRIEPGHPIQVPVVDIVEIGSGGGSIAWLDERGVLRVGPESAGSMPGPACYGRGGTRPTLSDAILTIGIFDPTNFAGGSMHLDKQKAAEAIATIAAPLGLSIEDAAIAIIDIAHASMINALKLVTVQRGHDPREVAFVISGGAGPALATRLGRDLSVKSTVVPLHPGLFSAWGMLAAEPRADFRHTWFSALTAEAIKALLARFDKLEQEAIAYFAKGHDADIRFTYQVEARYRGQEHGVFAQFHRGDDREVFAERFHAVHERAYSFRLPHAAIEITTLHLEAVLNGPVIALPALSKNGRSLEAALTGQRNVYFGAVLGWVSCPVYERSLLAPGQSIEGPMIVEEATATTLVQEKQQLSVADNGVLIIRESVSEAG
ncbi:hydantoinase/oxoprolinase family protein [Agrobacterium sp. SHOUNA12C]|uniref:N-methylhydantoinase (ATP-hydrolyzing)/5-oxoprolinase protein n=1 Tax=Rhizobium rhizogenes (strain K84 / ATCC BAA-868) TaxID=311403 RepID=B9JN69_RHIR8|nr:MULTISPECIES: hydantoinase/oxoprolinase family protein [Rhizobium]ACM29000.1 N-methylhydantoinase (ATP-hydrolyzing)/5-oxoprolinase protein [Rhizobium rhizogenes K84]MCJ9719210.1 hydantoinase/oxoprolinase family protein [Agrobacterium sp. BETTINA12B]MCJ9755956.1 hydantoinase/oxoprolinase family protein [Agrobacterium sp. SHOUNA12C]EJK88293.1 N-methylhydantoinase A/acetone carboxylase, beta subunit [Rhizobium sp. AP16]MDJ1634225.1 hydantoinase/oxoprolinase family protein [Rhizobium rhizogenes